MPEIFKIFLRRQSTMLLIAVSGRLHDYFDHLELSELGVYHKIILEEFQYRGYFYEPDPDALPWEKNFLKRYRLKEYKYIENAPADDIDRQIEVNDKLILEAIIGKN